MNTVKTASYEDRLRRVTAFIYDNLDQEIDLDRLADVACMSPYHWHRVYRAVYGETITATVKRIRLAQAAADLSNTTRSVRDIAASVGYANLQSFTRLFKLAYGRPPAEYRKNGGHVQYDAPFSQNVLDQHDFRIEEVREMRLACIPHTGSYMKIGNAFDKMFGILGNRTLDWSTLQTIGIYYDDPDATPEEALRSKAGFTISKSFDVALPLETDIVKQGRYAILRHRGPYSDMRKAYQWLYGKWLINSGEEAADAPIFEVYLNNPRDTPPADLLADIHLPLAG